MTIRDKLATVWAGVIRTVPVLIALDVAAIITAYAAFVGYGDNVFAAYDNAQCKSHFYDDISVTRDVSMALWMGSFFIIIGALIALYHRVIDVSRPLDALITAAILGIIASGLMALLASLTGTCKYPEGHEANGEVWEIEVFAAWAVGLGVLQTMLHDVALTDKGYAVVGTGIPTLITWLARLMVAVPLVMVMTTSEADWYKHYINTAGLATAECVNATLSINWENDRHKLFDEVKIGTVHLAQGKFEMNQRMYALALALIAAVGFEACCRFVEVLYNYKVPDVPEAPHWVIRLSMANQWFADITIYVFAYAFIGSNGVAACPVMAADNKTIEWLYISFVLFYGINTFKVLASLSGIDSLSRSVTSIVHLADNNGRYLSKYTNPAYDATASKYTSVTRSM